MLTLLGHQAYNATWCEPRTDSNLLCVHRDRWLVRRLLQTPNAYLCWLDRNHIDAVRCYDNLLAV